MKSLVAVGVVACWSAVVACGAKMAPSMVPAPSGAHADPQPMPGDRHAEIDQLARAIDDELANGGVATLAPAACADSQACTAEPLSLLPRIQDATCKPATTQTCTQSCTLSDSVCDNAGRICKIAGELGGADAYANEKCQSGNESCKRTREKCCGCT